MNKTIDQLFDMTELGNMIRDGYVRVQVHSTEPLAILNYTEKAQFEREWNAVTKACRGLIYNQYTLEIVARPFDKFFNYEEMDKRYLGMNTLVEVTDKQDGSLGILYPLPSGGWAVATRGSFHSEQAEHATALFNSKYMVDDPHFKLELDTDVTYLFEIIYPENRIVLDYGQRDELVLLGCVMVNSGVSYGPMEASFLMNWAGPVTKIFPVYTLASALEMEPRHNAEGIVVKYIDGTRVKIKQADYVALHRVITGLNDRTIWESLVAGKTVDEIKAPLPEEFWAYVDDVASGLQARHDQTLMSVWEEFLTIKDSLPADFTRKDFALAAKDSPNRGFLFKYLDNQPISELVWKSLKPEATRSLRIEEDS